jgi:hypothetical protein
MRGDNEIMELLICGNHIVYFSCKMVNSGFTEAFLILAGVTQGDTLASYLFVIAIDFVVFDMKTVRRGKYLGLTVHPRRSRRFPAVKVTDFDFADDLAPTTNAAEVKLKACF